MLRSKLKTYGRRCLQADLFAGCSVALLALPQAMAYAPLAGLPVNAGLLCAIFSVMVACSLSSSRHLIVGPTCAVALMIHGGVAEVLNGHYELLTPEIEQVVTLKLVALLSLMVGGLYLLASLCRLGRLVEFIGHPVMVGYIAAVACALLVSQLPPLLGVAPLKGDHCLAEKSLDILRHLPDIQWTPTLVGASVIALLALLSRLIPKWPYAFITLAIVTVVVSFVPLSLDTVGSPGTLHREGYSLDFLRQDWALELLPVALAIALLGLMEVSAVSRSIALSSGQLVDVNRDLAALGLANLALVPVGGMTAAASPSRSALNYGMGAQTFMSGVFSGIFVLIAALFGSSGIAYIPLAALAGLIIFTAVTSMVNRSQLITCLVATKSDALVLFITFGSAWFLRLDQAFLLGSVCSILSSLHKTRRVPPLHAKDKVHTPKGVPSTVRVIEIDGQLLLGGAHRLPAIIEAVAREKGIQVIVLGINQASHADATTCLALKQAYERIKELDCHLIGACVSPNVRWVLYKVGMVEVWGDENLFSTDESFETPSMERALKRAEQLINPP